MDTLITRWWRNLADATGIAHGLRGMPGSGFDAIESAVQALQPT